jgi:hypothetical protein
MLNIEFKSSAHLRITDITGKSVLDKNVEPGTSLFDTSTWQVGMYIFTLQSHDGSYISKKMIKY